MNLEELRSELSLTKTEDRFHHLRFELKQLDSESLFHCLFAIAVVYRGDGADGIAGRLLLELEPACPVSCRDALLSVAMGDWQLSDKFVPFYLVTQFGKHELFRSIERLVSEPGLSGVQLTAVQGIGYWASFPTRSILENFWLTLS